MNNDLFDLIHSALPGEPVWFQSASDPDEVHQEGLAIRRQRRQKGPKYDWYVVIYFRVVPVGPEILEDPEEAGNVDNWLVEIGYQNEVDSPELAYQEARELVKHLPRPAFLKDASKQDVILEASFRALEGLRAEENTDE